MNRDLLMTLSAVGIVMLAGCNNVPRTYEEKAVLSAQVTEAIAAFKAKDPQIQRFFDSSYGYAVLPKVFKGAVWLGGAYGKGQVFEKGKIVGFCDMKQASLGFSFGGEYFCEIIFFRDEVDLNRFMAEEYTFSAQVTGLAATAGAAAKADYKAGMAVFIATDKGLMVDASLGGQKFRFVPLSYIVDTNR